MRYIIPLVNGSYTEGDSAIVTEGTRNDSSTHKIIVAVNGAPQGGKITIQSKSPGRSNWSEVDYTNLSEVSPQTIEYTGDISQYRFIVQGASGSGSVIVSDTEEGEAITPFGLFGATGGMTPDEIGGAIKNAVTSTDVGPIIVLTQAEYDAITPDPNTLYIIEG